MNQIELTPVESNLAILALAQRQEKAELAQSLMEEAKQKKAKAEQIVNDTMATYATAIKSILQQREQTIPDGTEVRFVQEEGKSYLTWELAEVSQEASQE